MGSIYYPTSGHAPFAPRESLGEGSLGLLRTAGVGGERVEGRAHSSAGLELGRLSSGSVSAKARGAAISQRGPAEAALRPSRPTGAPAGAWAADLTVRAPRTAVCKCPHGPAPRACGPHVQ